MVKFFCKYRHFLFTALADLGFIWVLVHYGMGGIKNGWLLLTSFGWLPWALLGMVLFLLLYRSDYRSDLPLFLAGLALGYWGEWWGTTRGVWTYYNGTMPPDYLPPLWGLGLLTVYRLAGFLLPAVTRWGQGGWARRLMLVSFFVLPAAALLLSWQTLATVDWRGRLDGHFLVGLLAAALLLRYRFELPQAFALYVCGMILGGLYEYLGTSSGEWSYITGEIPPVWIVPLWGLATVTMMHLAQGVQGLFFGSNTIKFGRA